LPGSKRVSSKDGCSLRRAGKRFLAAVEREISIRGLLKKAL